MVSNIKRWWKYSAIRFYLLNASWNYRFWISCKKQYEEVTYFKKGFFRNDSEKVTKRRFKGYLYKGKLYLDNPGVQKIERDVWETWKKRGLI
jgi:hypothetical protein